MGKENEDLQKKYKELQEKSQCGNKEELMKEKKRIAAENKMEKRTFEIQVQQKQATILAKIKENEELQKKYEELKKKCRCGRNASESNSISQSDSCMIKKKPFKKEPFKKEHFKKEHFKKEHFKKEPFKKEPFKKEANPSE